LENCNKIEIFYKGLYKNFQEITTDKTNYVISKLFENSEKYKEEINFLSNKKDELLKEKIKLEEKIKKLEKPERKPGRKPRKKGKGGNNFVDIKINEELEGEELRKNKDNIKYRKKVFINGAFGVFKGAFKNQKVNRPKLLISFKFDFEETHSNFIFNSCIKPFFSNIHQLVKTKL